MGFLGDGRKSLGYIVSERGKRRLEYRTVTGWFDESPVRKKAGAYCTTLQNLQNDIDVMKRTAVQMEMNGYLDEAYNASYAADYMQNEVSEDVKKLLKKGLSQQELRRMPVCVGRLRERKWRGRTFRTHEAFHAKVRNLPDLECALETVGMKWTTTTPGARWLIEASRAGWTPSRDDATSVEEIMARLEEVRQSCVVDRRKRGCDDVRSRIYSGIGSALKSEDKTQAAIEAFKMLADSVKASGPIDSLKKAAATCQARVK